MFSRGSLINSEQILYDPAYAEKTQDPANELRIPEPGIYEYYREGMLFMVELEPGASYEIDNCQRIGCHRTLYFENDVLHRDDGPAVVDEDGSEVYYLHGQRHRDGDLPAVIYRDIYRRGYRSYWKHGKLHREGDKPAVNQGDGTLCWWVDGQPHRERGPSMADALGNKTWQQHGKLHREDGPAIEDADGSVEWYLYGVRYSEADYKQALLKLHG